MARFLPVLFAALVSFGFGALWYMALSKPWMDAAGKTEADMLGADGKPIVPVGPMAISFVAELVMAGVFAILLAKFGATTITGLVFAMLFWLGFVITTMATNNAYGGAKPALTMIDGGHWLGVLLIQGLILGAAM
ncbi:MAG: DUF1761 domain-containing protein [Hyphomicrobiales bacterium]|nr:DUF1761 domain-containing protein [Hyphomicrobiales bacterium]